MFQILAAVALADYYSSCQGNTAAECENSGNDCVFTQGTAGSCGRVSDCGLIEVEAACTGDCAWVVSNYDDTDEYCTQRCSTLSEPECTGNCTWSGYCSATVQCYDYYNNQTVCDSYDECEFTLDTYCSDSVACYAFYNDEDACNAVSECEYRDEYCYDKTTTTTTTVDCAYFYNQADCEANGCVFTSGSYDSCDTTINCYVFNATTCEAEGCVYTVGTTGYCSGDYTSTCDSYASATDCNNDEEQGCVYVFYETCAAQIECSYFDGNQTVCEGEGCGYGQIDQGWCSCSPSSQPE